jgi:hypothetical protein
MLSAGFFFIFLSLGAWIGSIALLSFVVAPTVFNKALKPPQPRMLDMLFRRYYALWQIWAAVFAPGAAMAFLGSGQHLPMPEFAGMAGIALACERIGSYSRRVLTPALDKARGKDKARFDLLHKRSVRLNSLALLALLGAAFLAVRLHAQALALVGG